MKPSPDISQVSHAGDPGNRSGAQESVPEPKNMIQALCAGGARGLLSVR
jgi:hypothetical protein